jgi:hypothetical protein
MIEAALPRGWPEIVLSGLWTEFRGLPVAIREQELFAPTDMDDFAGRLGGEDHLGSQLPGAPPVSTDP